MKRSSTIAFAMALALALSLGGCTTARVGVKATSTAAKGAVKVTTSVTKTVL